MKWKSTVLFRVTQDSLVLVEARVPPAPLASTRPRLEVRRVPTAGLASTRQAQAQLLVRRLVWRARGIQLLWRGAVCVSVRVDTADLMVGRVNHYLARQGLQGLQAFVVCVQ